MTVLFKQGLLYDGSEQEPVIGDVLVVDGVISQVGGSIDVQADRVVDCTGLSVSPGWIDAHSHNDFFYDYDNAEDYFRPFLCQGITTQVTGNCGFSVFGVDDDTDHKDLVGGGLFSAKNAGSYTDFKQCAKGRLSVNIAPLIGHGTARISQSGLDSRALTAAEIDRMCALVDEAMEGGAFGGSFGFMYEPGMYAPRKELDAFARQVAKHDGILTVHPRANSKVAMGYSLIGKPHIKQALDEVIEIARETGVRTEYSHLIFVGETSWKCYDAMLAKFAAARKEGIDIAFDNYAFEYGASVITVICPAWYMALSDKQRHTPFNRLRLRIMIDVVRKALGIGYKDLVVAYISDEHPEYEGRNVADIAREEGMDPLNMYLKLVDLSHGKGGIYLGKYYSDELIQRLMREDLTVYMTDAWYEPKGLQNGCAFQGFPMFLVRAARMGMPTRQVIHKMTRKTAERFRMEKRGSLVPGYFADITVFDENGLRVYPDIPDHTPDGIRYVMVNGEFAVDQGEYRTQHAGAVLSMAR